MLFISCFAGILLLASKVHTVYNQEADATFEAVIDDVVEESAPKTRTLESFIRQPNPSTSQESTEHCTSLSKRSLIFVSTTDGSFTCLNALSGQLLWSVPAEKSLVSSSISSIKSIKELADVKFIPSLNGNLYKWNGERLETVPLSADYLLGNIKRLPDGSYIVGGQEVSISGIDVNTGELSYDCTLKGCKPVKKYSNTIKHKDIISLRRTQKTIRVFEPQSGQEKWNYSVGNFDIELVEGESGDVLDSYCGEDGESTNDQYSFVMQDGVVASEEWTFHFTSPIASAWKLEDKQLKPLNVFNSDQLQLGENINTQSLVYLGLYKGQMYVQHPNEKEKKDSKSNLFSEKLSLDVPQIGHWRPLVATSPSRTPFINYDRGDSTALSSIDYPFDNGIFLYSNTTAVSLPSNNKENKEGYCSSENPDVCNADNQSETGEESVFSEYVDLAPVTIRDWWKEIAVLSVLIAIGINVAARFLKKKLAVISPQLAPLEEDVVIEEAVEEIPQPITNTSASTSSKHVKNKSSISKACDPIPEINTEEITSENASSSTLTSGGSNSDFTSRYLVDFDHLECLGKGGFGVVFKARKKIDEFEYAIKRIYLPQCEEAKSRMMREVRALAALEHPGIVRYFHAWWEAPPQGWQFELDRTVLMKDVEDPPSYVFSHDWALEVNSLSDHNKIDRSKEEEGKKKSFEESLEKCFDFESKAGEMQLLRHNDVFYSDESQDTDSFICFDENTNESTRLDVTSNSSVCSESDLSMSSRGSRPCHERTNTLRAEEGAEEDSFIVFESNGDIEEESEERNEEEESKEERLDQTREELKKSKRSTRRVVGKCCTRSSLCLDKPPLFLYIQMQLCKQETLKDWLVKRSPDICFKRSLEIFQQIRDAVEYFHRQGMMHRDLKPANIFFSLDGSVKVGDFGLVTAITRPSRGKSKRHGFVQDENHTGQVGTQLYMSPEQASGKPYSQKVDLYALGLILFELLNYFSTQMERIRLIYGLKRGDLPEALQNTPQGDLVTLLTNEDPSQRPEAIELKSHHLIEDFQKAIHSDVNKEVTVES
ncbi:eukaryotic translation initiation factor 2-alpha kinase 3-like isoform X2 [Clytia hemisphaerica]|uniref:non-specific serine/threonine protein kinase n=1 Tax=Clytia hemisphaerica TaxID=252671 RepID=A0A7M5V845_9CNID